MATKFLSPDTRGSTPLWRVFWIYGVLVSHIFFGAILSLYRQLPTPMLAALLAAFVGYTAWIMRSVWVNAYNVSDEKWTHIARALTVAWALNAVLVSAFLFLGHLGAIRAPF